MSLPALNLEPGTLNRGFAAFCENLWATRQLRTES